MADPRIQQLMQAAQGNMGGMSRYQGLVPQEDPGFIGGIIEGVKDQFTSLPHVVDWLNPSVIASGGGDDPELRRKRRMALGTVASIAAGGLVGAGLKTALGAGAVGLGRVIATEAGAGAAGNLVFEGAQEGDEGGGAAGSLARGALFGAGAGAFFHGAGKAVGPAVKGLTDDLAGKITGTTAAKAPGRAAFKMGRAGKAAEPVLGEFKDAESTKLYYSTARGEAGADAAFYRGKLQAWVRANAKPGQKVQLPTLDELLENDIGEVIGVPEPDISDPLIAAEAPSATPASGPVPRTVPDIGTDAPRVREAKRINSLKEDITREPNLFQRAGVRGREGTVARSPSAALEGKLEPAEAPQGAMDPLAKAQTQFAREGGYKGLGATSLNQLIGKLKNKAEMATDPARKANMLAAAKELEEGAAVSEASEYIVEGLPGGGQVPIEYELTYTNPATGQVRQIAGKDLTELRDKLGANLLKRIGNQKGVKAFRAKANLRFEDPATGELVRLPWQGVASFLKGDLVPRPGRQPVTKLLDALGDEGVARARNEIAERTVKRTMEQEIRLQGRGQRMRVNINDPQTAARIKRLAAGDFSTTPATTANSYRNLPEGHVLAEIVEGGEGSPGLLQMHARLKELRIRAPKTGEELKLREEALTNFDNKLAEAKKAVDLIYQAARVAGKEIPEEELLELETIKSLPNAMAVTGKGFVKDTPLVRRKSRTKVEKDQAAWEVRSSHLPPKDRGVIKEFLVASERLNAATKSARGQGFKINEEYVQSVRAAQNASRKIRNEALAWALGPEEKRLYEGLLRPISAEDLLRESGRRAPGPSVAKAKVPRPAKVPSSKPANKRVEI